MRPVGLLPPLTGATSLNPIEQPTPRASQKLKTPWAPTVSYLNDLRTKKTQLFQQLQIEIQALFAEQGTSMEEQQAQ